MQEIGSATASDWKQFLSFGEQLLNQPHTAAQSTFIEDIISKQLSCEAIVWFAEPAYPLPGEPEIETIPTVSPPDLVEKAFSTRLAWYNSKTGPGPLPPGEDILPHAIATPLITQDHLLGIIYLVRPEDHPFSEDKMDFLDRFIGIASVAMQVSRQVTIKNWHTDQLCLMQNVSEQIANVQELDKLYKHVTTQILDAFNYYYVGIYTIESNQERTRLRAAACQETQPEPSPPEFVKFNEGIIGHVAQEGKQFLASDIQKEPLFRKDDSLPRTKSEVALPLKVDDKILGVLDVQSDKLNAFHEIDLLVLRALANNVALAIESTNLYHDAHQRAEQISAILDFNHALNSILDSDKLIEEVVHSIKTRFGYPHVHLFEIDPVRRKIIYAAGTGSKSNNGGEQKVSYPLDNPKGIIPWVASNAKTFFSNDVTQDPLFVPSELNPTDMQSQLVVPVVYAENVLGIIDIRSRQKNAFNENDRTLVESLAASIAITIRNTLLFRSDKWRVQVADSFREVSELISSNLPLDDVLGTILAKLEHNLPCKASAIWLLEEPANGDVDQEPNLRLAAARGVDQEKIIKSLDAPAVRKTIENAILIRQPTIRKPEDNFGPLGASLDLPPDYSSIGAPLWAGDQSLGILTLAHDTPGRYGKEAQDMTTTFASYAAVAIQNVRFFEDAQEQAWVSTVLLQVAEASQSHNNVDELLATMVRLPPLLIGVKLSAILLWEDEREAFILKNWYGLDDEPKRTIFLENETPALARLLTTQSTIYIEEPVKELNISADDIPEDTEMVVMLPLLSRGNLLGSFLVGYQNANRTRQEQQLNQQILAILQGIAQQTAVAVENLRLAEAQEEEAYVTAVLLEVTQAVVSQNDLDDILDTIIHLMPILVGIDTCVIYLWDEKSQIFQPAQAFAGSHEDELTLLSHSFAIGEFQLLDNVLETDKLHFCSSSNPELAIDEWINQTCFSERELFTSTAQTGENLLFALPLSVKGEGLGVLLVKETITSLAFQERRMEIINGIARQVALAIQNELFKQEMVESERMAHEIQLASQSQQTFLPSELPRISRWELDARWQPARQVGGDFYDIIQLDNNRLGIAIADVADKGLAAALYMTVTRTLIRAYSHSFDSPAAVLEQVNNLLIPDTQDGMFVTAVYAILHRRSGKLIYANAGHNLPLILRSDTDKVESLPKGGIALGVIENICLEDHTLKIQPGDCLLLYTDGVTEAISETSEYFGVERLLEFFQQQGDKSASDILNKLEAHLNVFRGTAAPYDDVTLLSVRRQPNPPP
jgi:serine phosphatase RsbU (regulator of sigma subunit)/putative methionine-R-sulfoxide reductase with GAF domain